MVKPKTVNAKKYSKMDPIDHILLRSEMYVGSTRARDVEEFVADGIDRIVKDTVNFSPAILRIFIEPLSNAIDNVERSRTTETPCKSIKVTIDRDTGETSIWNDGDVVPIEVNEEEGCYNHSLIFGQLLTGSNYDDDEDRLISGRNGLGAKTCCVFSSTFTVEGVDPTNKKKLVQTWTNNMKQTAGPKVTDSKLKKGYTKVTWVPDFPRFGLDGYTDDLIRLYTRYVIDAAMLTKITVFLNEEPISIPNLVKYASFYGETPNSLAISHEGTNILVTPSSEFQCISFVNGVYTRLGGVHVDPWVEAVLRPLIVKLNKPKKPQINIKDVKQFFRFFVVSTVVNPEFNGQEKTRLETPIVDTCVKQSHTNAIMKWSVIDDIRDIITSKEMVILKNVSKKKRFVKIKGLDPANNAGGKFSLDCVIILCEGLSAKTYAVAGIEKGVFGKKGRDWIGVYPLSGKILNVRNCSPSTMAANIVVTDLIKALGVKYGVDYTDDENFKTLNYGRLVVLTDADTDGIHIEGLIINLFDVLFPSLLCRNPPFLVSMKTPIVRVFRPKRSDLLFYDENRFREYAATQPGRIDTKYYKGLGTAKAEDVPDTFGTKIVQYVKDANSGSSMIKAFHKKYADERKEWLMGKNSKPAFSLDDAGEICDINITEFVNDELIKFSHADCKRSIPNIMDGLKESMRKILYSVKKKGLKYKKPSMKVAQLGGYVAEHTNYHHGEANLYTTIVNMAHEFPGSNNIPLLYRDGMLGTRLKGGKDAAAGRYVFTKMDALTELIFRKEDDNLLTYVLDDGDSVEPEFYVPIIPMILCNGCMGIGTGWSCTIPAYNPLDLVECIKSWLSNGCVGIEECEDEIKISSFPDISPWYRGFKGEVKKVGPKKYMTYGIVSPMERANTYKVTELPVGMWTQKFKEKCEDRMEKREIKSMKNYSSPTEVHFELTVKPGEAECTIDSLDLHTSISISNMVAYTDQNVLKKYEDVDSILEDYCKVRYQYYTKRREFLIKDQERQLLLLTNKHRFVSEVINEELIVMKVEESDLIETLREMGYDEMETKEDSKGYNYLLNMQVRTFTTNKIRDLQREIDNMQKKLDETKATTEKNMWENELDEFTVEYIKWEKEMSKTGKSKAKGAAKGGAKKGKTK